MAPQRDPTGRTDDGTQTGASPGTDDGIDDLTAPQAENADLRRRNAELAQRKGWPGWLGALRSTAVVVLLVVGALLVMLSAPAIWGRNVVLNTDRYVQTMAPLARDPGVQAAIVKVVDEQFQNNIDVSALAKQVLPPRASVLAGPLQNATNSLVNTVVTRFVQSDAFVTLWTDVNRVAHKEIVAILTGKYSGNNTAVSINNDTVQLNLGPTIDKVKQQLVSAGLTAASNVPSVGVTFDIAQVKGLSSAQRYVRLLNSAAWWLPIIGVLCLIGAVFTARRRRHTVATAGLSVAGGMFLLGIGLIVGRHIYLSQLPGKYLTADDASRLYDTLVRYLRLGLRLVLVAGLLVAVIAWLAGPSRAAVAVRRGVMIGPRAAVNWLSESRFGGLIAANRAVAEAVVGGIAALIIVLWTDPPVWGVILVAVIAILLMIGLYWVKRRPTATPPPSPT